MWGSIFNNEQVGMPIGVAFGAILSFGAGKFISLATKNKNLLVYLLTTFSPYRYLAEILFRSMIHNVEDYEEFVLYFLGYTFG